METGNNIKNMTVTEARKLGVQQYRDGKTFAACNVRPVGFLAACVNANRLDLVEALDYGWHIANLAEPVKLKNGRIIGCQDSAKKLEEICNA